MKELRNIRISLVIFSLAALASVSLIVAMRHGSSTEGANLTARVSQNPSKPAIPGTDPIAHLKQSGQFESLGAAVTAARYEAHQAEGNAFATNYANQIRSTFSSDGLLIESNAANAKWQSRWRLQDISYGENRLTVGDGVVQTNGSRITIERPLTEPIQSKIQNPKSKIVEEWFNNTPEGLEHGFTLPERLSESSNSLRLTIGVEGDLTAQADSDGQNLRLLNNHGETILNYEKLRVWDADGVEIAAEMTTENGTVILEVEEAEARYPLTIDPTFTMAAKVTAHDGGAGEAFGRSVAISGDTVIIGAPHDDIGANNSQGSAYIFVRGANGLWTHQAKLIASDGSLGDKFGDSVAISNNTVVVGSPWDDFGPTNNRGSAYVYQRSGTTWTAQEKLLASDGAATDSFGNSVGIHGETIIVAAYADEVNGNDSQGSAYIFVRNAGVWTQQQKLTAADPALGAYFGISVAIAGNVVIIGKSFDTINGNVSQGSAYIFSRTGTTWTQQQKLTASDGAADDFFGSTVGISTGLLTPTTAIVGVYGDDIGGINQKGSAYVFTRSGTTWTLQQKLTAADGMEDDFFGQGVAVSGNTVIVGADIKNGANPYQGAAYIFTRAGFGTIWTERQRLSAFDGAEQEFFGRSVAIDGDTAVVGAYIADVGANGGQGAAYIFQRASKPFDFDDDGKTDLAIFRPAPAEWWYLRSSDGGNAAFQFGASTDRIVPADFTGDGRTDVAVWRPSSGEWFILRSHDSSFYSFPFGANGDIPAPADFDGDGEADAAVFRPSNATWYVSLSDGGTLIQQFGANGDVPAVGDYDADGRADIAIWRPSLGQWWIQRSALGTIAFQFGNSADKPVQADYTGDGKADVAIFRPSTSEWFVLRSQDQSFYSFPFGANGDLLAPGDYDNDGKFDATVFRPSTSTWYSQRTTAGTLIQQFGQAGDRPVPNAFVP